MPSPRRSLAAALILSAIFAGPGRALAAEDPRLAAAMSLDVPSTGVSIAPDGRRFLVLARLDGSGGPQVVEWKDGALVPYPDAAWNGWSKGRDPAGGFVRVNAQRIGPDGALWLVDTGAPGIGNPVLAGGPKLIRVDLATNRVARVYPLAAATKADSFVDDVRFNGAHAYLTDAGAPGLIVLDLASGQARRVLDRHPSTLSDRPVSAEGKPMHGPDGKPLHIHADQLEVSPDGRWFYYQPSSGRMSRIETRYLDDPSLPDAELARHVEPFADTPSTGGTAIDAAGNLYVSDTDRLAVLKVARDGATTTLVQDPRLVWVDAMWIDAQGRLWLPAAQLDRMAPFNDGKDRVERPIRVFTLDIGARPAPNDHR
ncbi:MAG: L-dopachrome tautomerase-related protein [Methylorubrum populi]